MKSKTMTKAEVKARMTWYNDLDVALADAGYEMLTDTPVFDFISSEGRGAEKVEGVISDMCTKGIPVAKVVGALEDRDRFCTKYKIA